MSSIFSSSSRRSSSKIYSHPSSSRSVPTFFPSSRSYHASSSSSSRPRPRAGYIAYLYNKLRRLVLDLWRYARKNPLKAFLTVAVPLLSASGAIVGLLKAMGIGGGAGGLVAMLAGQAGGRGASGGYYGSAGYGAEGTDVGGIVGQVLKIAGAFV